jgi:hypothetical protein
MAGRQITLNHPGAKAAHFLKQADDNTRAERLRVANEKLASGVVAEARKLGT